jgi:hypothetical protein
MAESAAALFGNEILKVYGLKFVVCSYQMKVFLLKI